MLYLCFEIDEKRAVFPESSVINFDENGFTVRSLVGTRQGKDMAFVNMDSYKGAMASYEQAIRWVRRMPNKPKTGEAKAAPSKGAGPSSGVNQLPEKPSF